MRKIGEKEFDELVNYEGLVVVDFYADWCMPCRYLGSILEKLSKEYRDVKFYKVNVDENRELAIKYKILSIPTVLFFKRGKVVDRFVGVIPERFVRTKIESALSL